MGIKAQPSHVVVVSSNGQFGSHGKGVHLTLDEINSQENYDSILWYGQSKLCNVLFAQELSQKFKKEGHKIYVNSLNPGAVNTELVREYPQAVRDVLKKFVTKYPDTL